MRVIEIHGNGCGNTGRNKTTKVVGTYPKGNEKSRGQTGNRDLRSEKNSSIVLVEVVGISPLVIGGSIRRRNSTGEG